MTVKKLLGHQRGLALFRGGDSADDAVVAQFLDFQIVEPEQIAQDFLIVLTERRREVFDCVRQLGVALAIGD